MSYIPTEKIKLNLLKKVVKWNITEYLPTFDRGTTHLGLSWNKVPS